MASFIFLIACILATTVAENHGPGQARPPLNYFHHEGEPHVNPMELLGSHERPHHPHFNPGAIHHIPEEHINHDGPLEILEEPYLNPEKPHHNHEVPYQVQESQSEPDVSQNESELNEVESNQDDENINQEEPEDSEAVPYASQDEQTANKQRQETETATTFDDTYLPSWTSCDINANPRIYCHDCTSRLFCNQIGGLVTPCPAQKPYCNGGFCSSIPTDECS